MNKELKKILHSYGHKATPARLVILEIFSKNSDPINAEKIFAKIKNKNIDMVTVYRTLSSLEKSGLLRRVEMKKDSMYFEFSNRHHHHNVCTKCDTVEDFENKEVEKVLEKIIKKSLKFKNIREHSLELFGLCKTCR
jgi:Fe2+ or Zn2+ uptake regulation protein